jgi:hypothetical protein
MPGANLIVRMARWLLVMELLITGSALAAAQQNGVAVDQVHAGTSLVVLAGVPVRDHAPAGGAVYVRGQQTGTLRSGEVIDVGQEQMVSTVLGNQKWIYFSRSGKQSPSSGWVMVGKAGAMSDNFGAKH